MARRRRTQVRSPFLSMEEVERLLVEGISAVGSWAGGLGGRIRSGGAEARGGASGGEAGARFAAGRLTRIDGDQRVLAIPRTEANMQRVRAGYFGGNLVEQTDVLPETNTKVVLMAGVVGSGTAQMNPCVIQVVWSADEVQVTAHAKEGLINQRTCAKALRALADVLS